MSSIPRMITRYDRQVELTLPHNKGIGWFQVGAANTLDTAFAGTTAMFTLPSGGTFRSPGITTRRLGRTQNNNRGLSWMLYDPEDYWVPAGTLPHDNGLSFLRVSEVAHNGVVTPEGPILIVPAPGFFVTPRPHLSVVGTAPMLANTADFTPPTGAMHFILPRFADYVDIYNKDAANPLFVSFGETSPGLIVPVSTDRSLWDATLVEVYVWATGGTAAFDMHFAIVNGEMA